MPERIPEGGPTQARTIARAILLALWLVVFGALTLTPQSTAHLDPNVAQLSACLICGARGTSDAVLNLLLLVPLGMLLNDLGWRPARVAGAALVLSAAIELDQHFIPGRFSNLGDVAWNTTGAWLGALLWCLRGRWLPGTGRDARRFRNFSVLIAPLVTFAFGWLMVPDWPAEPYWGQWTPDLGFMEQYKGRVLNARLDSFPLPSHQLPAHQQTRTMLMRDWTIEAALLKGPSPATLAPIVNIYDGKRQEVTMLGAIRQDLVYRERTRASRFRLDDPALWYPDALATAAVDDTVRVGVLRRGEHRCLMFNESEACPAFTPGRAWALVVPFHFWSTGARRGLDIAWMLLLLAPTGFWSERKREAAVSGAIAGLLLALAIAATRIVVPPWTEVAGAVLGLVGGYGLRMALGRWCLPT